MHHIHTNMYSCWTQCSLKVLRSLVHWRWSCIKMLAMRIRQLKSVNCDDSKSKKFTVEKRCKYFRGGCQRRETVIRWWKKNLVKTIWPWLKLTAESTLFSQKSRQSLFDKSWSLLFFFNSVKLKDNGANMAKKKMRWNWM